MLSFASKIKYDVKHCKIDAKISQLRYVNKAINHFEALVMTLLSLINS